ncbi:MAG: hypothetical protein AAB481_01075 [Patescibacteria group bacterium]
MTLETEESVRAAQIANVMRLAELARKDPVVLLQSDKYSPENRAAAQQLIQYEDKEQPVPWGEVLLQMDEAVKARSA